MNSGSDAERLKGNLDLLLLSVLANGPAHGYAVVGKLREASGGTFDLPEGTVYPALHRLERAEWLTAVWERGDASGPSRRRKVYSVTAAGQRALTAERTRWTRFSTGISTVLDGAAGVA
ncbi:PadR family transcriptional regulator [Pengzhenrongella sp.]|jgi:DNA-binding PadR family transcriptional regulator|uniref:PadR family transcriptional regulator n=1 Tax=Pengzhenrongella sp. TaxID=2888820 RepID=UPI002F923EA1